DSRLATNSAESKKLEETIEKQLSLEKVVWVKMFSGLDIATKEKIDSMKIAGLSFIPEQVRDYAEASLSAHLLGFVGESAQGGNKGYFGLEGYYDKEL